jgi:hypothetical protein
MEQIYACDSNYRPITMQGWCWYRWVSDFMFADGVWNVERLQQYFLPVEVAEILKTRPLRTTKATKQIEKCTNCGELLDIRRIRATSCRW